MAAAMLRSLLFTVSDWPETPEGTIATYEDVLARIPEDMLSNEDTDAILQVVEETFQAGDS